jgi:PIN domain nuclease of toxin-antitoxin system
MKSENNLFLDTCALIWLVTGGDEISQSTKEQIENASLVFISPISGWEISLKEERGLLKLPMKAECWLAKAIENHNLTIIPLDMEIFVQANRLPWHHKDPADRFIIASAIIVNAVIVTADTKFSQYEVKTIV